MEREDRGEEIDEDRLYELDLFDKWQSGEDLDEVEAADLEVFKKERRKERKYRREFQDLLDRRDRGENVDEDCFYCLDLFARRHLGKKLKEDELLDLEDFENEEKEAAGTVVSAAAGPARKGRKNDITELTVAGTSNIEWTNSKPGDGAVTEKIPSNSENNKGHVDKSQGNADQQPATDKAAEPAMSEDSSLSSAEIEELNMLMDRQEKGVEIDEDHLYELDLFDKWKSGKELDSTETADLKLFKSARQKERKYRREFQDLLDRQDNGEDVDEDRLYCLELFA